MPEVVSSPSKFAVGAVALLRWLGEAVVGLVPLMAFKILQIFSQPTIHLYLCPVDKPIGPGFCQLFGEDASQEVCILTVVISGLALWSLLKVASGPSREPITPLTQVQVILSVLSLLSGAMLYALYGAHIAKDADRFSYIILAVALMSSLFIAIERAILAASEA
ncbi:hypothetical protein [Beijerinckia sp. L45]|uniref:hypothetical protein n=1 Tax=Beijerinckia sp. L45 TaxID=1641855 RepID=UPI00131B23A4|nr:hypothetical protein [Beijerinckia sp. L45]